MYSPPWGRSPGPRIPDLSYLLNQHRRGTSRPRHPDPYDPHANQGAQTNYFRKHKATRFSPFEPRSFYPPDWDDTDSSISPPHHPPPSPPSQYRRRHPSPRPQALSCISLTLPSATTRTLQPRNFLVLPPLVNLHILLSTPHTRGPEEIHAAVPKTMAFGETIRQVVHAYVGADVRGCDVTARVEQRGRMREPEAEVLLGDLVDKGEVWREGRREIRVEVMVVGEEGECARGRGRRRPSNGGADVNVETVREREFGRTRFARG